MSSRGYVTFVNGNPKYIELTKVLVESVLSFSKYELEVFCINADFPLSHPRLIKRRVDVVKENFSTICYCKLYASSNSSFNHAVQLDADMILTKDADTLFDKYSSINELPLGSLHPADPHNQASIMDILGVKEKTQPYIHATYIFSKASKPFLNECWEVSQYLLSKDVVPANMDETILNVLLWKYGSIDYANTYDPYCDCFCLHCLNSDLSETSVKACANAYNYPIDYFICHGEKNVTKAWNILNRLKKMY
jgi:hypothetical protein